MFGYVMANTGELDERAKKRYQAVYCGICRQIRLRCSQTARLALSYDMAFLAILLSSLYEPEETSGSKACRLHPVNPRPWVDNEYIRYCADMNVALAYYKALDDAMDENKLTAKVAAKLLKPNMDAIETRFPRQCKATAACIRQLYRLERENCQNPDEPAGCFGQLMGELFVYREDMWSSALRQMGMALGRFIYLADAAADHRRDLRKGQYNPFAAMGCLPENFEQYLVLAMGRCTDYFERLPLVQDKALLDNILYSGVWIQYRRQQRERPQEDTNDR